MKKSKSRKIIQPSLQGGGARGAYEYGAIKALYSHWGPGFKPRVVTGVSIGAINAAVLVGAKADPLESLDTLWRERFCVNLPAVSRTTLGGCTKENNPICPMDWTEQARLLGNPGMYARSRNFSSCRYCPMMTAVSDTSLLKNTLTEVIDLKAQLSGRNPFDRDCRDCGLDGRAA